MAYQAPKGTKDVLPQESYQWQYLEAQIRALAASYGYLETRTPVIEHTELFLRGIGGTTDVVQKEMYTFNDKGDRSITLKPEGTAGMVRMFVENGLFSDAQPTKVYYLNAPVFRYDRPQAGRLREHHQFGVELFGAEKPGADAECISLVVTLFSRLGLRDLTVLLNSIGCPACRPRYQEALIAFLSEREASLCETCRTRLAQNPLRVLDCKVPACKEAVKGAPSIQDYICDDCRAHFETLCALLDSVGIAYRVTPSLVRGLDYYTRTVFEIVSDQIGAQGSLCGGGRYDGLIAQLGGPAMPAVGFGMGMERVLLLMRELGLAIPKPARAQLYVATLDEESYRAAFPLVDEIRRGGVSAEIDNVGRSLKAQFKYADKLGAKRVLTVGGDELAAGRAKLKNLSDGATIEVSLSVAGIMSCIKQQEEAENE